MYDQQHVIEIEASYFDEIQMAVTGERVSTMALKGSTEEEQFAALDAQGTMPGDGHNPLVASRPLRYLPSRGIIPVKYKTRSLNEKSKVVEGFGP